MPVTRLKAPRRLLFELRPRPFAELSDGPVLRRVRPHEDSVGREVAEIAGFVGNGRGLMPVVQHGADLLRRCLSQRSERDQAEYEGFHSRGRSTPVPGPVAVLTTVGGAGGPFNGFSLPPILNAHTRSPFASFKPSRLPPAAIATYCSPPASQVAAGASAPKPV